MKVTNVAEQWDEREASAQSVLKSSLSPRPPLSRSFCRNMITRDRYEYLQLKYGKVASWAVWDAQGERPKSNMSARTIFDLRLNPSLLDILQPNVVMVGLNFSRQVESATDFANFHDESPHANDFKIRYAFEGTAYYGAYMTDVLKNLVKLNARSVREYLKQNPDSVRSHIEEFERELADLGVAEPLIIAFGRDAFGILKNSLKRDKFSRLIQITHYSHQIRKENYRDKALSQIEKALRN